MRIGQGYDSHRFAVGRRLVLGGVEIPHDRGLAGHSDADAVAHAITDALLGAAGLGDIGRHFPPTDEQWKGADSMELLARVLHLLEEENYQVVNVDVTVIAEAPKIGPHADAMRARLAGMMGISPEQVSVKGKSNEGMGWTGQGEGIAALAVALIDRIEDQDRTFARASAGAAA
jgi:2-C-methyl-D-erythritol 2,4-cyclodiphosphate synthase